MSLAGNDVWSGTLAVDEKHSAYGRPRIDGTVDIYFQASGRSIHRAVGYVTPGPGERHILVVLPSLEVRYATQ